jgi:hypothetical protein
MAERRVVFKNRYLPYLLVVPQLLVTAVFFLWPAFQAMEQSFYLEDAFGFSRQFVRLENYQLLIDDPRYLKSFGITLVFGLSVTGLAMGIALTLALAANRVLRGALGLSLSADMALCGRPGAERGAVVFPAQPLGRHICPLAGDDGSGLEPLSQRQPRAYAGDRGQRLEANQL